MIAEGDVLDQSCLEAAMRGHGVVYVYANLAGAMKQQAEHIAAAMRATHVKRLIFISSMVPCGSIPLFRGANPLALVARLLHLNPVRVPLGTDIRWDRL